MPKMPMNDARAINILQAVLTSGGDLDVGEDVAREVLEHCLKALEERANDDMSVMKNYQVASCFVDNARAYLKSGDYETVATNLQLIETLLEQPNAVNSEYEWEDFK